MEGGSPSSLGPCFTGQLAETPPHEPPISPIRPHVTLGAAFVQGQNFHHPRSGPGHAPSEVCSGQLWPPMKLPESRGQAFFLSAIPAPGTCLDRTPCLTGGCCLVSEPRVGSHIGSGCHHAVQAVLKALLLGRCASIFSDVQMRI